MMLLAVLAGCVSYAEPALRTGRVDAQVLVPCCVPVNREVGVGHDYPEPGDNLPVKVYALLAERLQRVEYEKRMAAVQACQQAVR